MKTNFFERLIKLYSKIKFPPSVKDISKIDGPISWYMADDVHQLVSVKSENGFGLLELDLSSAYPTICKCVYGENDPFVKDIYKIKDKLERNIFIATTLKETDDLRRLNNICKIIIMGVVYENAENTTLLELKKDGCIVLCNIKDWNELTFVCNSTQSDLSRTASLFDKNEFQNFILENGFRIHYSIYDSYYRTNKTTFILESDWKLVVKGQYKHIPKKLKEIIKKIITLDKIDLDEIKKIYSNKYFKIAVNNNLDDILYQYYICDDNGKIISSDGRYINMADMSLVDPQNYLKIFIYPFLASIKENL